MEWEVASTGPPMVATAPATLFDTQPGEDA